MSPDPEKAPLVPADILTAVDNAIEEHGHWLTVWHRALVCGLPPDSDIIDPASETLTRFGAWQELHVHDPLLEQMAFKQLWRSFKELHREAGMVARGAAAARVQPEAYDAVIRLSDEFLSRARKIRDAFRKAVADLDPLTGLSNRTTMMAELTAEYDRALRSGTPCCIALTDIDHFKKVNDIYGHSVGDEVLAATAGRLLSRMRPYDLIYRYGGEEFLLCLPNADPATTHVVLERLRHVLAEMPIPLEDGRKLSVTSSFGFALFQQGVGLKETLERADRALYWAKKAGRNRIIGYARDMEDDG